MCVVGSKLCTESKCSRGLDGFARVEVGLVGIQLTVLSLEGFRLALLGLWQTILCKKIDNNFAPKMRPV